MSKKDKKEKFLKRDKFLIIQYTLIFLILISNVIMLFFDEVDFSKSRLVFNIFQCVIMLVLISAPLFLQYKFNIHIPKIMINIYIIFCLLAFLFGEILDYYARYPWWDSMLHFSSGILIGILGFVLVNSLNEYDRINIKLNPFFICIFSVCFVVTVGTFWELIEYCLDGIFGSNMQQYMESTDSTLVGEGDIALIGHSALADTMKDLALDTLGGVIISIVGFFHLRNKNQKSFVNVKIEIKN